MILFKYMGMGSFDPGIRKKKMGISEALDIDHAQNELICFVGAGGKTTTIFKLAKELKRHGKRILVTTTTAIFYPDAGDCDEVIVDGAEGTGIFAGAKESYIIAFGREVSTENKLLGADKDFIDDLYKKKIFNYILVEGDGAKRKPIKAPASYEPVIPESTTKIIGVIGLDSLGKKIDNNYVHRPELFCKVTGREMGEVISEKEIVKLILSAEGLFKTAPDNSQKYLLLNKAENRKTQNSAMSIIESVKENGSDIHGFIVASIMEEKINVVR